MEPNSYEAPRGIGGHRMTDEYPYSAPREQPPEDRWQRRRAIRVAIYATVLAFAVVVVLVVLGRFP